MEKKQLDLKQVKNRLLWYLSKRDHSLKELKDKLRLRSEFHEEDFILALEWLKKYGYLPNEEALAQRLVKKFRAEGRGKNYIQGKLRQKGLRFPTEDTQNAKGSEDSENPPGGNLSFHEAEFNAELEAAQVFIEKRLRGREMNDLNFEELQALKRKLTTRGFSYETVGELLKIAKEKGRNTR